MIGNKKDWEMLDAVGSILIDLSRHMTEKQKAKVNEFIRYCADETTKQKERRTKTAKYIAEKRKTNKNYARTIKEK